MKSYDHHNSPPRLSARLELAAFRVKCSCGGALLHKGGPLCNKHSLPSTAQSEYRAELRLLGLDNTASRRSPALSRISITSLTKATPVECSRTRHPSSLLARELTVQLVDPRSSMSSANSALACWIPVPETTRLTSLYYGPSGPPFTKVTGMRFA